MNIKVYFLEILKLFKEIVLFIFNLPIYFKRFLETLRVLSRSYYETLVLIKKKEEMLGIMEGKLSAETITNLLKEGLRLRKEAEKIFIQLVSVFISIFALIISICALVIKMK